MDVLPKKKEVNKPQKKVEEPVIPKGMKEVEEVVACVVDYGTFICLAEKLAETFDKVYYYTPTSQEFYSIEDLVKADGIPGVERVYDIFEPDFIDEVDLFIFPDIGYGGLQNHLRSLGKAVWGSMGVDTLEVMRTEFVKILKKLNLPVIKTVEIEGLTELRKHLDGVQNKWVKIDKYRGNMETWHHIDKEHSSQELDRLALQFGGLSDTIKFVVQDFIDTKVEIGYDGWTIDGKFPKSSFQGYEAKDELYLASVVSSDKLSKQIRQVNEAMAPIFKKYSYRNFYATEIRVKDDIPYFIDPTLRMPGMSGEQLTETCYNLPEIIWYGANGILIEPEFSYMFAATATVHYKSKNAKENWSTIKIPEDTRQWFKVSHCKEYDDMYHFPPRGNNELGIMIGAGDTIEEAVQDLVDHIEELKPEPVYCELDGFNDLIESITEAKKHGIYFTDQKIPDITKILP